MLIAFEATIEPGTGDRSILILEHFMVFALYGQWLLDLKDRFG
jgi:hypothetical protein